MQIKREHVLAFFEARLGTTSGSEKQLAVKEKKTIVTIGENDSGRRAVGVAANLSPKEWIILALATLSIYLFQFLFANFQNIYDFLERYLGAVLVNLLGVVLIFLVGIGLYRFRETKRLYYGAIEVSFALAYGWYAISKVTHVGYVEGISVIAAVYLVVRGIDNFQQGRQLLKDSRKAALL